MWRKTMVKKSLMLMLVIVLVLGSVGTTFAGNLEDNLKKLRTDDYDKQVQAFVAMGIMEGDDDGNLMLEDHLTRAQAAAIYTRLFGMDWESHEFNTTGYKTGFTDVPQWAARYVNFLHSLGIANGVSKDKYGSDDILTEAQFTTMILRGIGYSDKDGEFTWDKSLEKALEINMLTDKVVKEITADSKFTRGEMIKVAYNALFQNNKKGEMLLLNRQRDYSNSVLGLMHIDLTDAEIKKILTSEYNSGKKAPDSPGNTELFTKVKEFTKELISYAEIQIDGKPHEYKVTDINNIVSFGGDSVYAVFEDGLFFPYVIRENKLVINSDKELLLQLYIRTVMSKLEDRIPSIRGAIMLKTEGEELDEINTKLYSDTTVLGEGRIQSHNLKELLVNIKIK